MMRRFYVLTSVAILVVALATTTYLCAAQELTSVATRLSQRGQTVVFYAPADDSLQIQVVPESAKGAVQVIRAGSYGGRPLFRVKLQKSIEVHVKVRWSTPLIVAQPLVPPFGEPHLNPGLAPHTRSLLGKQQEQVQDHVGPDVWYVPQEPHVRIETQRTGVAVILATDVAAANQALLTTPNTQLRLYHRGHLVPIAVVDSDQSGTFTTSDSIYFVGSQPRGDTTYLDTQDTVAVFFLTRRSTGEGEFLKPLTNGPSVQETLNSVFTETRFELDTGYYHPGSDNNENFSTFLTPTARFEGFYWDVLNARAGGISTQSVPFTPFVGGRLDVVADVITSTDATRHNPDHFVHVSANGAEPIPYIGDGFQRYQIVSTLPTASAPATQQTVRVFSKGTPDVLATADWFSEVLLDGIMVRGDAAMILHNGSLHGNPGIRPPANVVVHNADAPWGILIDTVQQEFGYLSSKGSSLTVRAGLVANHTSDPYTYRRDAGFASTVQFANEPMIASSIDGAFQIATRGADGSVTRFTTISSADITAHLKALDVEDVCVITGAGRTADSQLRDELLQRGVTLGELDSVFIVVVWGNVYGVRSASTNERTCGVAHVVPGSGAATYSIGANAIDFQNPRLLQLGAGSGIERAIVVPARFIDRTKLGAQTDVIVVTTSALIPSAQRWAQYRSKVSNVTVHVADVAEIFNSYDAGRHSPEAVRAFFADVWNVSPLPKPTHGVLFGNASWDVRIAVKGGNAASIRPDLVPTYGRPSSDYWLGLLDDPNDLATPELIMSRFPVLTADEANAMINKIIVADSIPFAPWHRTFLYAGGGETVDEGLCEIYQDLLTDKFETGIRYTEPELCVDTITVCKATSDNPGLVIRNAFNQGVGMVNYIGHGGTEVFDIRGWEPADLVNTGRYPILATYSCLTGAFSNSSALCKNGQYVVQPDKGAVAAIGATGWQYQLVVAQIHIDIHETLRKTPIRDLGRLTYAGVRGMATLTERFAMNSALQFNILGDPFTKVRIDSTPQVSVSADRVRIQSLQGGSVIRDDQDSAVLTTTVWSEGTGLNRGYNVVLRRQYQGTIDSVVQRVSRGPCLESTLRFAFDVRNKPGVHSITIEVDPERTLSDRREDNVVTMPLTVFSQSMLVVHPDVWGIVHRKEPRARIIDVLSTPTTPYDVVFGIASAPDTTAVTLRSVPSEISRDGSLVDWNCTRAVPSELVNCWLGTWAIERNSGVRTAASWIPVTVSEAVSDKAVHQISAHHLSLLDTTLEIVDDQVRVRSFTLPLRVRSSGVMTSDPDRDPLLVVELGGQTLLRSSFRTGINVIVFGNRDTVPAVVRRFDTSKDPAPVEAGHSGYAAECLRFLSDSIRSTDRVVIAVCNESFSRFITDGLLDSLRTIFRSLGATRADSLTLASSYILVGSKHHTGEPLAESWKGAPAFMAATTVSLPFHFHGGRVRSAAFGPAQNWQRVELQYSEGTNVVSQLVASNADGSTRVIDTLQTWVSTGQVSTKDTLHYEMYIGGSEERPSASLHRVMAWYEPLPQWIIEPGFVRFATDTVLVGTPAIVLATVRNARIGWRTPESTISGSLRAANGGVLTSFTAKLPVIDSLHTISWDLPTSSLESTATARVFLPDSVSVMYRVLDRGEAEVAIARDATNPTVEAWIDGRFLPYGGTASAEPHVEIRLRDNSSLPITDAQNLIVFINGVRIREDVVTDYEFLNSEQAAEEWKGLDVRAALRFRYPLEPGENLLIVRARDATNNADTLEIPLVRADNVAVENIVVAPNPTIGATNFLVDAAAAPQGSMVSISIFDVDGREIRNLEKTLTAGVVAVPWDGRGQAGEIVSSAVYAWRATVGKNSASPTLVGSGLVMVVR